MTKEEIQKIAKKRGVTLETVKRWVREKGEKYARTYIPLTPAQRGASGRVGSTNFLYSEKRPTKRALREEDLEYGARKRKIEDKLEELRRKRELMNVWEIG